MRQHHGRLVGALVLLAGTALAEPNDIVIERLGNPATLAGANGNFRILTRELGAAITAANLMPPETLGHAAFSINLELSVVSLDGKEPPATGTLSEGFALPTEDPFNGPLLVPSVHVRKGLPFSFELGGRLAWLDRSSMFAGTAELKWAPIEGFAALPDVGVRIYGSRLFNTPGWSMGTGGLDLGVGKSFPIGGMVTLTPYAGWNLGFTGASSSVLDFAQTRSYAEAHAPPAAQFDPAISGAYEDVDFFGNPSNRFYVGGRFIGGVVQLGAEVSITTFGGFDQADGTRRDMPTVGAFNATLGLDF